MSVQLLSRYPRRRGERSPGSDFPGTHGGQDERSTPWPRHDCVEVECANLRPVRVLDLQGEITSTSVFRKGLR